MLLMLKPTPVSAAFALGLIGIGYGIVSGLAAGAIAQYWRGESGVPLPCGQAEDPQGSP